MKNSAKPSLELYKPPVLRQSSRKNKVCHTNKEKNELRQQPLNTRHTTPKTNADPRFMKQEQEGADVVEEEQIKDDDGEEVDFDDLVPALRRTLDMEHTKVGEFLAYMRIDEQLAVHIGEYLVKYAVENSRQRHSRKGTIVRVFAQLSNLSVSAGDAFFAGICAALQRYFECREMIRESKVYGPTTWISFITLVFELGQIPHSNDRLAELIFDIFEYLFTEPIIFTPRISELESALSALMILGSNLELEYPTKVANLKDQLRDAFITTAEAWARRMILLLIELGANGWKMSSDLEQYYFR